MSEMLELLILLHTRQFFDVQAKSTRRLPNLVNPRERIAMVRAMIFLDVKYIKEDELLHRARAKVCEFQWQKRCMILIIPVKKNEDGQQPALAEA